MAKSDYPDNLPIKRYFTWVCTVCKDKLHYQRNKYYICLEIVTCQPSIYIMGHVESTVSYFMEYSISIDKKPTHTYLVSIAEAIKEDAEKPMKMYSLSQSSLFP